MNNDLRALVTLDPLHLRVCVCIVCTWAWVTGLPVGDMTMVPQPHCPRCGWYSGVPYFRMIRPGEIGVMWLVEPK